MESDFHQGPPPCEERPDRKSEEGPQKLLGADIGSLLLTITRVLSYSILFSTLFVVIYYSKA